MEEKTIGTTNETAQEKKEYIKKTLSEAREETTQMIVGAMKEGKAPWQNPELVEKVGIPQRLPKQIDEKPKAYKGVNAMTLMTAASVRGYSDPRWLSASDTKEKGLSVKAGEKATFIETADFFKRDDRGKKIIENSKPVILEKPNVYITGMFNVEQLQKNNTLESVLKTFPAQLPPKEPNLELAEKIIKNTPVAIEHTLNEGEKAKYNGFTDTVSIQPEELFKSKEGYYAEVLHQLSHATGFAKRDNREGIAGKHDDFSREAIEEAVKGEMASIFIRMETGLKLEDSHIAEHSYASKALEDHALKNDGTAVNKALFAIVANDANRMTTKVIEWSKEREKTQEQAQEPNIVGHEQGNEIAPEREDIEDLPEMPEIRRVKPVKRESEGLGR